MQNPSGIGPEVCPTPEQLHFLNVTAKSMDEAGRMWQAAHADEAAQPAFVQMKNDKTTINDHRDARGTKE
jgi:hypothetical protein